MSSISFEEIMFTIMSATQDTFKSYLNIDLLAGRVEKKLEPVESDVISIVGVAGEDFDPGEGVLECGDVRGLADGEVDGGCRVVVGQSRVDVRRDLWDRHRASGSCG